MTKPTQQEKPVEIKLKTYGEVDKLFSSFNKKTKADAVLITNTKKPYYLVTIYKTKP